MTISFPFRGFRWLALGLLLIGTASCAQAQRRAPASPSPASSPRAMLAPYQTEKFELSAGPGVPEGYPARIMAGRFINSSGGGFVVPYGHFLEGDWGMSGIVWGVGDELQAVPERLELRWFSYTDDKFYEGHFLLLQERLYALLKQGYWNAEEKNTKPTTLSPCAWPRSGRPQSNRTMRTEPRIQTIRAFFK